MSMSIGRYFGQNMNTPGEPTVEITERCQKCGCKSPPTARYAKDERFGERLVCTCRACGYKWSANPLDRVREGVK